MIYEDDRKNRINLGLGFNPIFTEDGKVALIRGGRIGMVCGKLIP